MDLLQKIYAMRKAAVLASRSHSSLPQSTPSQITNKETSIPAPAETNDKTRWTYNEEGNEEESHGFLVTNSGDVNLEEAQY